MKTEPESSSPDSLSSFPLSSPGELVIAMNSQQNNTNNNIHVNNNNKFSVNNNTNNNNNRSAQCNNNNNSILTTASSSSSDSCNGSSSSGGNNFNNNNNNNSIDPEVLKKLQFKSEQIDCICEALLQAGDMHKLGSFLSGLPTTSEVTCQSEIIQRAKVTVAYHRGAYKEVYNLLENHNFSGKYHSDLQDIWYRAHYKEAEKIRQRPLGKIFFFE